MLSSFGYRTAFEATSTARAACAAWRRQQPEEQSDEAYFAVVVSGEEADGSCSESDTDCVV